MLQALDPVEWMNDHAATHTNQGEDEQPMIPLGLAKVAFVVGVAALAVSNTLAFAEGDSLLDSHIPTPYAITSLGIVIGATWAVSQWSSKFVTKRDLRESERRMLTELDKRIREALDERKTQ